MFSLKRLLLNKTLPPLFMDWVHLLLFNIWSLVLLGAHLVDLRKKNGLVDHGATQLFHLRTSGLGIQHLNHQATARLDLPISFLFISKHCSISLIYSQSNRSIFCLIIFHSPSFMKCHSSFRTIKQNKSQSISNNCGCLILLARKHLPKQSGFIQLISFNTCAFNSYLKVWPLIFNFMLSMERHQSMFDGTKNRDVYRTV